MTEYQTKLVKDTRKIFYDKVMKAANECDSSVILVFPEKLWQEHRIELVKELITIFGKVKLGLISNQCNIVKMLTDSNEIPQNVEKIIIDMLQ